MLSISLGAKAGLAWDHAVLGAKNRKMTARAGIKLCRIRFISTFLQRIIESNVPGFAILRSINAYGHNREKWAAVALNYFAYNFIQIHRTLRTSPAMAAGVTDRLWSVADLVALWEREEGRLERAASFIRRLNGVPIVSNQR